MSEFLSRIKARLESGQHYNSSSSEETGIWLVIQALGCLVLFPCIYSDLSVWVLEEVVSFDVWMFLCNLRDAQLWFPYSRSWLKV